MWGRFWPPVSNAHFRISGMTLIGRARDRFAFLRDRFAIRPIPEGMQLKGNGFAKDGELRQSEPATR